MLHAIEVIVEPSGLIRPLEELHVNVPTKAVLTLLESPPAEQPPERGNGTAVLALLQTPRFAQRPAADAEEVAQRIQNLRDDWGDA